MFKARKFTAVIFSTVLLTACVFTCFIFSSSALSQSELLTQSQYHYQSAGGYLPDTAPYPNGCFVELYNPSNGYYIVYNFERQSEYFFGNCDSNGEVISSYAPFIWELNPTYNFLEIFSGQPIYYFRSRLPENGWEVRPSTTTSVNSTTYYYNNGVLTSKNSTITKQHFTAQTDLTNYPVVIASCPSCSWTGSKLQYNQSSSDYSYTLAPMVTTSYLSSVASFETANKLYSILTEIQSLNLDSDTIISRLNSILSTVNSINSVTSEYIPIIQDIYYILDDWYMEFSQYASDDLALQEQIEFDLQYISEQIQTLIDNYEGFDSDDTFGSDVSGFSDVASDFSYSGSGISSVIGSLGSSFNLLKVNFEYICNFLGLNEVIVLLLGFSLICFVLGRAVHNRMRD